MKLTKTDKKTIAIVIIINVMFILIGWILDRPSFLLGPVLGAIFLIYLYFRSKKKKEGRDEAKDRA